MKYKGEIARIMEDRNDKKCIKAMIAVTTQDAIFSI